MMKLLRSNCLLKLPWLFLLAVNFTVLPAAFAQESKPAQQRNCSAMEVLEQQLILNPERARALQAIEEQTNRFIQKQQGAQMATGVITIPVVVHVVYNNSTQNISRTQVQSQIQALNRDFRRTNLDADNTWSQAADVQIEFKLATVSPTGGATQGIVRKSTSVTSFSTDDAVKFSDKGGSNAWPADSYLNLWVCNLSDNNLGYAQFPGGSAATDGVVIGYKYFGTTGTVAAPFNLGRTTTHEVGHWLNLRHIWGDGDCSVDDGVSDTPASDAPNYSCDTGHVSCKTVDMVQNYMDYSDDACMNLFTAGQKARMRALFANGGARAKLLNSRGLGGGSTTPPATCTANQVKLKLVLDSYPAETSWQLKASNGSIVASGGPYSTAGATINETFCLSNGCYDFIISDSYGDGICCSFGNGSYSLTDATGKVLTSGSSFTKTQTKKFCVGTTTTPSTTACPAINFSSYSISGFADQTGSGTHQVQDAGATLFLSGNAWRSIPYNYKVTSNTVLEFEYRSTVQGEVQGISFENDNATTPGTSFKVYGTQNWGISNYKNYSGTSWKKYTIPVGTFFTGSFTKLVFMGDDDYNNKQTSYFRNVKVYEGSCGTTRLADLRTLEEPNIGLEAEGDFGISLFPNPVNDKLYLELKGEKSAIATLYNITGKKVWKGILKENSTISVDVETLPPGLYTLRSISESGAVYTHKFIKE